MLESYSVALNIKEVRSNSQVLFFQIHPENRITIPYTFQYYCAHFILFLFTFSFFLFLGQHSVWTVLLWSLFCLRSVPASSVPRKFIGKYPKIRTISTILLTFWFLVAKPSFSLWSNVNDMHQLDQALVQISKVFSDITGTTEYFDKIQNSRYFENKEHYENLFRCFD